MHESTVFRVRAWGPLACFTRPEMKAERVSYEVMTPSAARGLLSSILWKPAVEWNIHEISVLAPIAWSSFRRNEANDKASLRGGDFFVEDRRAQRNTVALRNVNYVISASLRMTPRAGPEDNLKKFEEMFARRLEKGQHFQAPYLGCREFVASVEPAPDSFEVHESLQNDRPLGLVFYDFDYPEKPGEKPRPLFFQARLTRGVMRVPPLAQVRAENLVPGGAA